MCQIRCWHGSDPTPAEQEAFRAEARGLARGRTLPAPGTLASLDTAEGFEAAPGLGAGACSTTAGRSSRWPEEYGGRDVGIFEWLIFEEEYYRAQAPTRVSQNGIFLLAPTLFEFGTRGAAGPVPAARWPRARDLVPGLVGARRRQRPGLAPQPGRARRGAGGGWVLNGQKTWCSRGAFADWCFGLFRTDPEAERHRGLTYFLVPMDAPGVTVRPIPQIDGETGFAEIFFEDVFVPDDQVLGRGRPGLDGGHGHGRAASAG